MNPIRTELLFRLDLAVGEHHVLGQTPAGSRRIAPVAGGTFHGPQLSGIVLPGGTDWITEDSNGSWFQINVRLPLQTHEGELVVMAYKGFRSGQPDILQKVARGEPVDPNDYYYRVVGTFETSAVRLSWLNTLVAVGVGSRSATGPAYDVFAVL
ncbi:hypothetical protein D9X30_1698 (plasmid) [Cupriavidus sp. U2]|uniref:DUF3237 domain-containing protein n=1 Tax=Cupriavidus sp. U2 TaxID=2920269 RepID=UPI00129D49E9|nr:DUF3237 domain-containing protein [Cupriavidus sp. U2]KAI3593388.1 hypothetical protein D9X30_1698 [Cupriavidus sp. U2]